MIQSVDRSRNISRGVGFLSLQNVVNNLLGFIFLGTLTRLVTPVSYGAYSAVQIASGLATALATMGFQFASARYTALSTAEESQKSVLIRAILLLSLGLSLSITLIFVFISPYLSLYFVKSTQWTPVFALGALWLFSASISTVIQGILQGMKRYTHLAKILFISRISMVAFSIAGLEIYKSVIIAIIAWVIYNTIIVVWGLSAVELRKEKKPEREHYRTVISYSLPLGLASLIGTIGTYADLIVVGGYLNLVLLGVYNLVLQITSLLNLVLLIPLNTILLPEFASSQSNLDEISIGLKLSFRFLTLCLLPVSFLIAAVSTQLLLLFSSGSLYLEGSGPLEIIAITFVFSAIPLIVSSLFQATGNSARVLLIGSASLATEIIVSLLLVPSFGIYGAAISRIAVGICGSLIAIYYIRGYLSRLDAPFYYLKSIAASALPFLVVIGLSSHFSNGPITIIPYTFAWLGIFLICLKFFKLLSEEDRVFIMHLLPTSFHRILKYF